ERNGGGHPYLDVFLNLKLKRARFFFKYTQLSSYFLPKDYFTVLHYPVNGPAFKFGLSWAFYD
ncbi:MAG: putative porin, partial [Bacteroidetes bacterium]|nr:putative porin [Bacteroidota bacterium]